MKTLLEDLLGVLRSKVDVAIANDEWMAPSMSPMVMPVLTAIEKGVSEFPQDKRALTTAEIGMAKAAFNQLAAMTSDTAGMRDFDLRPKFWNDIEIFLKHEQKKEDLVVDPSKSQALEKVMQFGCLLMKMLSTIGRTKVDGSSLSATLGLQLEKPIELVRPALLRHFTKEEFGVQVRRMKDMLAGFISNIEDTEIEEVVESIQQMCLLLENTESKGRSATPAEVSQIKESFAKTKSQK